MHVSWKSRELVKCFFGTNFAKYIIFWWSVVGSIYSAFYLYFFENALGSGNSLSLSMHLNNSRNFFFCKVLLLFTLKPFFSKVLACSIICQCVFFCSEPLNGFWIELDVLLMTFDLLYQGESSCCLFSIQCIVPENAKPFCIHCW